MGFQVLEIKIRVLLIFYVIKISCLPERGIDSIDGSVPVTYMPARNTIFISLAGDSLIRHDGWKSGWKPGFMLGSEVHGKTLGIFGGYLYGRYFGISSHKTFVYVSTAVVTSLLFISIPLLSMPL